MKTFKSHTNVEWCQSVKSIKYILKYVHKGSDQGAFGVANRQNIDEIAEYQAGRYINSNEAIWRILGFPIHERYPAVIHLDIHLENGQRVYFTADNVKQRIETPPRSSLIAFFELCATDDFAKTLFYNQVTTYYTYDKSKKIFSRRKQGRALDENEDIRESDTLSRVYTVSPKNAECYFLRLLLHKFLGPTSFESLRTVEEVVCNSYQEACLKFGLLASDRQWDDAMNEATECDTPFKIRSLFAILLVHCEVSNPKELWEKYREAMSEDFQYHALTENSNPNVKFIDDTFFNKALIDIDDKINNMSGKNLSDFGLPSVKRERVDPMHKELTRELSYDVMEMSEYVEQHEIQLTDDQCSAYNIIKTRIENKTGGLFFLDAPGGTGKTFLSNLLLASVRRRGKIALAMASSGIAATLLTGGRTAHSTLKLPLDLLHTESPVCNIKKGSAKASIAMRTYHLG